MRSSPLGADFPAPIFLRTPIAAIRRVLRELDAMDRGAANIASATNAQLCYLVRQAIHIFSHQTSPYEGDPKSFLPFPDFTGTPEDDESTTAGPSELTRLTLREALRQHRIPLNVYAALITPPSATDRL